MGVGMPPHPLPGEALTSFSSGLGAHALRNTPSSRTQPHPECRAHIPHPFPSALRALLGKVQPVCYPRVPHLATCFPGPILGGLVTTDVSGPGLRPGTHSLEISWALELP